MRFLRKSRFYGFLGLQKRDNSNRKDSGQTVLMLPKSSLFTHAIRYICLYRGSVSTVYMHLKCWFEKFRPLIDDFTYRYVIVFYYFLFAVILMTFTSDKTQILVFTKFDVAAPQFDLALQSGPEDQKIVIFSHSVISLNKLLQNSKNTANIFLTSRNNVKIFLSQNIMHC